MRPPAGPTGGGGFRRTERSANLPRPPPARSAERHESRSIRSVLSSAQIPTARRAAAEAAVRAVRAAAHACRTVRHSADPAVLDKADKSPVTVADFAAQALVCRALADAFPDDPVIGEEDAAALRAGEQRQFAGQVTAAVNAAGNVFSMPAATDADVFAWIDRGGAREYSERFWTLDPIDGTKGFLRGGQYAVSLALIEDGELAVGVLGCPNLTHDGGPGAIFCAVGGAGATVQNLWTVDETPLPVSTTKVADPAGARLCESVESAHTSHGAAATIAGKLGVTQDPLRLDSQAKYAEVARGGADIYLRLPTRKDYVERIWDHAAGVLVVEEAGGRVTDVDGEPLDFTRGRGLEKNRGVVATNGPLHGAVLAAVRAAGV